METEKIIQYLKLAQQLCLYFLILNMVGICLYVPLACMGWYSTQPITGIFLSTLGFIGSWKGLGYCVIQAQKQIAPPPKQEAENAISDPKDVVQMSPPPHHPSPLDPTISTSITQDAVSMPNPNS